MNPDVLQFMLLQIVSTVIFTATITFGLTAGILLAIQAFNKQSIILRLVRAVKNKVRGLNEK